AEQDRLYGRRRVGEWHAECVRRHAKAANERPQSLAAPALRAHERECRARCRRDRLRQRGRIHVGARLLDEKLDEFGAPGDEGAEGAEGLAERADEYRHSIASESKVLEHTTTVCAHYPEAMCIVDDEPEIAPPRAVRELRQRRQIAVHTENPIG